MGRTKGGVSSRDALNFSDNNSQEQEQVYDYPIDSVTVSQQQPTERFFIFKLVDTKKKGGSYIDGMCDAYNPATKRVERARLLSGVPSIWIKDQKDISEDYVRQNRRSIVFPRSKGPKMLQISERDEALLEYARIHPKNCKHPRLRKGVPDEFFEYNPAAEAEEALARETKELESAILASQQSEMTVRKHGFFLGIRMLDDYGIPKEFKKIKQEYIVLAKRDPTKFNDTLNSKDVEIFHLVRSGVTDGKIDISSPDRNIRWASGNTICRLPERTSAIEYLVELALTNSDEGREFLQQLQSAVQ